MRLFSAIFIFSFLASGCATMVIPEPGKVTLEEALSSVGRGLVQMKQAQTDQMKQDQATQNDKGVFKSGLIPSEVEVTFNITASGQQGGKLFVEITKTPVDSILKKGAEFSSSYAATRGNQITIRFRNIAFTKTTKTEDGVTVEGVTNPETLSKIIEVLERTGSTVYNVN